MNLVRTLLIILTIVLTIRFLIDTAKAEGLQCTDTSKDKVDIVTKCPKVQERWRTVVKEVKVEVPVVIVKTKTITKKVNVRKNHLSLLAGVSKTKLKLIEAKSDNYYKVGDRREFDLGLQYLREFNDNINLGAQVTKNGNLYLIGGISW